MKKVKKEIDIETVVDTKGREANGYTTTQQLHVVSFVVLDMSENDCVREGSQCGTV